MIIFPAIDLYGGKAVRLLRGDYRDMTVYSDSPADVALDFKRCGATHIHTVDLEGAKEGAAPNLPLVAEIVRRSGLFVETGGGIRRMETIEAYLAAGVQRVILGTSALANTAFLKEAVARFGRAVAVGADVKDGCIAVNGWLETSSTPLDTFLDRMQSIGIENIICTDISKDGAMRGTNLALYRRLSEKYGMNLTASGGISSLDDVRELRGMNLYGAIIGRAYYTGAINLKEAIEVAK